MKLTRRNQSGAGSQPWEDLAAVSYFEGLPRPLLRAAGRSADWVDVAPGTRLQRQGMHAGWLWVAVDGPLELHRNGELVGTVPEGQAYGEAEVLLGMASPVDVVAPAATTVVSFPARAFHGLLGDAEFATAVARRQARTELSSSIASRLRLVAV